MKFELPIDIKSTDIEEKRGTSKLGKPYHIREQCGYADLGKPYPSEIRIPLDQVSAPYPIGPYVLDPACLYVDHYGRLSMGRLKLLPANPAHKK